MAGRVNELTSAVYRAQLVDEDEADLPLSAIVTITLTLYNFATGAIINSRNAQSVLNINGVTISSSGALEWTLAPADNPILDSTLEVELHIALFRVTFGVAGVGNSKHEYPIAVVNLSKVQ